MIDRRLLVPLLTLAALLAASCSPSTSTSSPPPPASPVEETIKIGIEGPMTGDQLVTGIDMWNAATLAADEANANGGVAGKQIELVRLDDAANPETGVAVAHQAVDEGVFAVIGPYNSSVGIENLPIYLEGGVIPIHLTSTAQTDGKGYTVQPKDYQVAPVEGAAITGWLKQDSIAILFDPSEYTRGVAKQLESILKDEDATIAYKSKVNADFPAPVLVKNVDTNEAGLAYSSTYFPEGAQIAKAAVGKMKAECFMGLANQDQEFIERAGIPASQNCYFSGVPSPDQFPGASDYVKNYGQRFTSPPGTWGPFVYDSLDMLFAAAEAEGSWNADAINELLKDTTDFQGITGPITIDPRTGNRPNVPIVILKVTKDGAFIVNPGWAKWADFPTG